MSDRRKSGNCNKPYRQERDPKDRRNKAGSSRSQAEDKPPPELKGKALGLWYRDRQVARNTKSDEERSPVIILPRKKFDTIEALLSKSKESSHNKMLDSKFKDDFLEKIKGSFQEHMDKMMINPKSTKNHPMKDCRSKIPDDMMEFRMKLPCYKMKDQVLEMIRDNRIVVISGETGCGKTTQIVQYVLDEALDKTPMDTCNIVCTQPRRISAISVAERVAAERCERIGVSVGYQIRLEKIGTKSNNGTIMFVTTGIVLQWIQDNPLLIGYTHLFLDEVHERDILSDFVLACLLQIMKKRSDLKVILMSATLNAERFSEYFEGAPCLHIPGFTFPVEEIYLEKILELTNFTYTGKNFHAKHEKFKKFKSAELDPASRNYVKNLEKGGVISRRVATELVKTDSEKFNAELIASLVHHICRNEREGAILIFAPGIGEIQQVNRALGKNNIRNGNNFLIVPLHSTLPTINQRSVFMKPREGMRKIVIATNIAETSITIDDVVFVIDCGFLKMKSFNKNLNVSALNMEWIAVSNARQRRGRAGRVQAGKCYKMYTTYRESMFEPYPLPEMQRTRLEEVVLKVKMLKLGQAEDFLKTVLDPPDRETVKLSVEILKSLNALDENEKLTPLGFHLAKLPLDPQIGKMLLMAALFGCVDPIMSIAACLSFKEPFSAPLDLQHLLMQAKTKLANGHKSDHYVYHAAISGWEEATRAREGSSFARSFFLSEAVLRLLRDMKQQFAQHLFEMQFLRTADPKDPNGNFNSENWPLVKAIVCAGLYPNVAIVKRVSDHKGKSSVMKIQNHPKVMLHKRSVCSECSYFESPYLVYHMILQTSEIFLHDVTLACPWTLLFFGKTLDIVEFEGVSGIRVDSLIKINCFKKTAMLIQKLRKRLDGLLADAIANPGVIDWSSEEKPPVLEAIVELITAATENM